MLKPQKFLTIISLLLLFLSFGCDRKIKDAKIVLQNNPEEFFLLYDEAISYKIQTDKKEGKIKLDISPLRERISKYEELFSAREFNVYVYSIRNCWELYVIRSASDYIVTPVGREIVISATSLGQLGKYYRLLCDIRMIHVSGKLGVQVGLMDRLCTQILCPPEMIPGEVIFEEFPELEIFDERLGLGDMNIGGLPPPPEPIGGRTGNICDECFGWNNGDIVFPVEECYEVKFYCPEKMKVNVINMMPNVLSGETAQDSEPFLTVQLDTMANMIGSAFTTNPNGAAQPTAPVYMTSDTGNTWQLINIVNSQGSTRDITVGLIDSSFLVAGILRRPTAAGATTTQSLQSTNDFWSLATMAINSTTNNSDQPFAKMYNVNDTGYVFVGNNNTGLAGTASASVDLSQDYGQNYNAFLIENRNPNSQDAPSIRPSMSDDGTVYAGFARYRNRAGSFRYWDITVVRDDNFGRGNNPFQDLVDPGDNIVGCVVDTGRVVIWNNGQAMGQHRVGSNLVLAAHPTESDIVYIGWADTLGAGTHNLHIRRSTDRGQTWSGDLVVFTNAIAPAMDVAENGVVGVLYHQLVGTGANQKWDAKLWQMHPTINTRRVVTLATTPANTPVQNFQPYLGDYTGLVAVGNQFRGVFSANNTPDLDNFPYGVTYQRNANFTTNTLTDGAGGNVNVSIDPFYFTVNVITR